MNIDEACIGCIINQGHKVASAIDADIELSKKITSRVENLSKDFSFKDNPPQIASYIYAQIAQIANKEDLYDKQKKLSTKKALSFVPFLKQRLANSKRKLLTATKIAVAGNVIDLATEMEFDLEEELTKVFDTDFSHDNFAKLQKALFLAKEVVILGDNVGEHIFDYMFIEVLKELFPKARYTYMVRGVPIINDVTIKEAKECGFDKLCNLVDSGVNTPGFVYDRATKEAQKLFDNADLVISKGMGNYECLTPSHRKNICFILKVKCGVVASSLGKNIGDIICKMT